MACGLSTAVLLATALLLVHALPSSAALLKFDAVATKERPVSKVIVLLKEMLQQLEKEAEEDEEIYDKLACWCATNDKEKATSIAEAQSRIAALTTKIEELSASSARLNVEIKILVKEVAKNQESLDQATALRQKQLAAFTAEEKDMLGSISALKSAIVVLSKHHSSLLQVAVPRSHMLGVATTLEHEMQQHGALLKGVLTRSQRRAVTAFVQSPYQSYAPQSGEIFGILKQMQETFESNLAASQKEEQAHQRAYEDLKAAKEAEIQAGKEQINAKTQELADTDDKQAHATQDLEDTKKSLGADEQFLLMLKEKCQMTDKEWEERQRTRKLELEALSKALAILSSDASHDVFTRTFNPALLQRSSISSSQRRADASAVLSVVAKKHHNEQLAVLADRVRLDSFERVKKAIDDLVTQLLKEKDDEIKQRDFCIDDFNTNQKQTEEKDREKEGLVAKIEDLQDSIKALAEAIDVLKKEIADTQAQLKVAGENREKANKEFQAAVADQRETQKILKAALEVLGDVYGKKAALLQASQPAGPPPPPGFSEYKKSAASGGVLDLLEQIINDAKAAEAENIRSEEEEQKAYEDFVKDSNASVETKSKEIVNKSEEKARKDSDVVAAKESRESVLLQLEELSNYNLQLHQSCDFVLKNFELRQTARDEEVEALRKATAILSGASFAAFLQQK